mmetsp:Transcript_83110/g.225220  ORF Transcript_83110/g.225220 Transcript_83110/m.225220 type:complete len:207 (-) Transcript_83110:744-1364(-)
MEPAQDPPETTLSASKCSRRPSCWSARSCPVAAAKDRAPPPLMQSAVSMEPWLAGNCGLCWFTGATPAVTTPMSRWHLPFESVQCPGAQVHLPSSPWGPLVPQVALPRSSSHVPSGRQDCPVSALQTGRLASASAAAASSTTRRPPPHLQQCLSGELCHGPRTEPCATPRPHHPFSSYAWQVHPAVDGHLAPGVGRQSSGWRPPSS